MINVIGVDLQMDLNEEYFLSFLESMNVVAAQNARKMEELIYEDPSSSIVKARLFAEAILNEVFTYEKIELTYLSTFYEKISYLTKEGYIEREIQQSFDIIRLSGNKAAHDGNFNDITVAFKLHKEMYKIGVWFYEVYSLEQLRVPLYDIPKPREKENIQELVKQQILELLGTGIFETDKIVDTKDWIFSDEVSLNDHEEVKGHSIFIKDLEPGQSYLLRELRRLKDSSQEAIENANQFSSFKDYLHVDRKIQLDLERILENNKNRRQGNLILLCGSVGDGKSHLLAYLKEKKRHLIDEYTIFNDATESFSPNKNAMETLEEVLYNFSDEHIENSTDKVILAINMGVLHNFINTNHKEFTYNRLYNFVEQSDLFSQNVITHFSDDTFDLLSFGDYHAYEITESGPKSSFYSSLFEKIFNTSNENPFYLGLKEDEVNQLQTMVHENYKLLQNKFVQDQIVQLIIQVIVTKKLVISARTFLNFVADILIPDEVQNIKLLNEFNILECSVPNLLFNRRERSSILQAMSQLDPIHRRSIYIDQLVVDLNTLTDWNNIIDEYITDYTSKLWLTPFLNKSNLTGYSFNLFFESFIRITLLTNEAFSVNLANISYNDYLKNLYYFNTGDKRRIKWFYDQIKLAIFKWKGSPKKGYIYLDKPSETYRLSQKLNLQPSIDHLKSNTEVVLDSFKTSIVIAYYDGSIENKLLLDIDFPLYQLLTKVIEGYRPNKKDEEDAIQFVEFIEKLMEFGEKKKEMLIYFPKDNRFYTIKRDSFEAFVFEREY